MQLLPLVATAALVAGASARSVAESMSRLSIVHSRAANSTYCTPSQKCWPNQAAFDKLNSTVNGNLIKVVPWADPCFTMPNSYRADQCSAIENVYLDGFSRADVPGTTENDNWAYCYTNANPLGDDCSLQAIAPALGTTIPLVRTCKLGRISPYAVAVQNEKDVQAALAFAQANNIKVVIKNTGHEYLGRATAPDTLMIWTHQMKTLQYSDNFQPDNCGSADKGPAIIMGAGAQARDVYAFAKQNNKAITLGAYGSVGVGGGFAQGGGHGPLGPKYGLAVDNVRQYKIVTADGQFRSINQCNDPDLFFALRGGGGGVWGVVTEVAYVAHPQTPIIAARFNVSMTGLLPNKDQALTDFVEKMAEYQEGWTDMGWAGYTFFYESYFSFNQGLPSDDMAAANKSMQGMFDFVMNNPNYKVYDVVFQKYDTLQDYVTGVLTAGEANTPVAFSERLAGRLIPRSLFASNDARETLAKAVSQTRRDNEPTLSVQTLIDLIKPVPLQIYSTGPPNTIKGDDTGVNPAWRSSLWEVVAAAGWTYGFPEELKQSFAEATHNAMDNLRKLTPGGGCYYSEADVLEEDWQTAFFGSNYQRSPPSSRSTTNTFIVWKGIGYEGQENQAAFACYEKP